MRREDLPIEERAAAFRGIVELRYATARDVATFFALDPRVVIAAMPMIEVSTRRARMRSATPPRRTSRRAPRPLDDHARRLMLRRANSAISRCTLGEHQNSSTSASVLADWLRRVDQLAAHGQFRGGENLGRDRAEFFGHGNGPLEQLVGLDELVDQPAQRFVGLPRAAGEDQRRKVLGRRGVARDFDCPGREADADQHFSEPDAAGSAPAGVDRRPA